MAIAEGSEIAGALGEYVKKVTHNAYKITDDDIVLLRKAGYSEDEIFEATVSAALRAGLVRIESGLKSLEVKKQPTLRGQAEKPAH
jgi:alkylhydroperoxidase family enzyme